MLVGVIIGIILFRVITRPKNQIIYCRERDGRAMELDISKEDHISLETNTEPPLRFFKYGRSYELRKRGRAFTRFFGKEGTAYSWLLEGFKKVSNTLIKRLCQKCGWEILSADEQIIHCPSCKGKLSVETTEEEEPKSVDVMFPTLAEAVKSRWGDEFYATVPDEQKALLEENKLLVTVNLETGITPKGYEPISESVILLKADEDAAQLWAASIKGAIKEPLTKLLITLGAGAGIGWIANFLLTGI